MEETLTSLYPPQLRLWFVPEQQQTTSGPVDLSSLPALAPYSSQQSPWLAHEAEALKALVQVSSPHSWAQISRLLNSKLHCGQNLRSPKQCKEYYREHLCPVSPCTRSEDLFLLAQYNAIGPR